MPEDIIILHFEYHKWQSWCMVSDISSMTDRIFCHFALFLPFYPSNNPENQNFEKMKKAPGDIIIYTSAP